MLEPLILNEFNSAETSCSKKEVGLKSEKEVIEESTCFFRKMIEEMEILVLQPEVKDVSQKTFDPIIKEDIDAWEENKEQLIQLVEGVNIDKNENKRAEDNNPIIYEKIGEMTFVVDQPKLLSSTSSDALSSKVEYIEEIEIEEVGLFPLSQDIEEHKSLPLLSAKLSLLPVPGAASKLEAKDTFKRNKSGKARKWFRNKFRKLFHFAFARKNHQ